ncbi:hypothetical protein [Demequina aestuarii]|uniref:hypothetical protein n=1 Tax=Demequina aestuarii TaxID=327095 RepID=UPI00078045E8|nr:hypothetical protein [Demequina aestuarii]
MTRNAGGLPSDDQGEMTADEDFTDRDLSALFSGRENVDARLADLVPAVAALRSTSIVSPPDDQVASMAVALSRAVPATTDGGVARARTRTSPRRASALSRRLVAIAAGAGLLGAGFAGAAAADGAAPGDALYGLDRAFEGVGINDGGAHERLAEVRVLLEAGDVDGALRHAEQATDELEPEATEALRLAAASVASAGSEQSLEVREQVSAMLTWMSETDLEGREFGQGVAERARAIGNGRAAADGVPSEDSTSAAAGNAGTPQQARPSVGADGGTSGSAGKPEVRGKQESAGDSGNAGDSDDAAKSGGAGAPAGAPGPETSGPPAGVGAPNDSAPPAGAGKPEDPGGSENAGPPADAGENGKNAGGGRP